MGCLRGLLRQSEYVPEDRVACYVDNIILVYGKDRDEIFLIIV